MVRSSYPTAASVHAQPANRPALTENVAFLGGGYWEDAKATFSFRAGRLAGGRFVPPLAATARACCAACLRNRQRTSLGTCAVRLQALDNSSTERDRDL